MPSNGSAVPFNASTERSPSLQFNEDWFLALDKVIATAGDLGVRLIIPFINMIELEQWGGASSLARWAGVKPTQFFQHDLTITLYKKVVWYVLSRRNRITGRNYKDEPAIFGWELGNELFSPICDDLKPPHCGRQTSLRDFPEVPIEWTRQMAEFIRGLDANHLIISGSFIKSGAEAEVADIDLLGGSYYYADTWQLEQDIATVNGQRPILVKEFGLAGDSGLSSVNDTLKLIEASPAVAGVSTGAFEGMPRRGAFTGTMKRCSTGIVAR